MKLNSRYIIVIFFLGATIFYTNSRSHGISIPTNRPLKELPEKINDWIGTTQSFSKEVYDILKVDDSIFRNYSNSEGNKISLYIGYYESQKQGELIHSPKNCMIGSGWMPIDISEIEIDAPSGKMKITKMIIEKGLDKEVVLYWYQSGSRVIANEYIQRLYFIWDSIRYNRTNGAFIRLTSPIVNNEVEKAVDLEKKFIKSIVPLLNEFLPS